MAESWKEPASAAMDRYACGDDAAFAELYDLLAPRLSSFLVRRTRDAAYAEDLLQQTFMQMHCARRHFVPGACVMPWAFAIARRLLIDGFRKGGREIIGNDDQIDEPEHAALDASPEQVLGQRRLTRRIEEELSRMPSAHREAFELVQCDGLSMAEAAEYLGTTVAAVKLRAHRTYVALRATLGADVHEELEGSW
jgi:RNA polymerase sigma-70 factor (ECF subfamily)